MEIIRTGGEWVVTARFSDQKAAALAAADLLDQGLSPRNLSLEVQTIALETEGTEKVTLWRRFRQSLSSAPHGRDRAWNASGVASKSSPVALLKVKVEDDVAGVRDILDHHGANLELG